ncbi:hypothetical protein [Sandarakinorhabdus sp. AAP62]|uniref:hypothetical protein n=1 Tax=Sandarakinorhabdus sp. AAP62 TaxID=1248916 RepID=UPI0003683D66|nr:hypothetical protein [Sandarakinorhabdus sp. AAP62]
MIGNAKAAAGQDHPDAPITDRRALRGAQAARPHQPFQHGRFAMPPPYPAANIHRQGPKKINQRKAIARIRHQAHSGCAGSNRT